MTEIPPGMTLGEARVANSPLTKILEEFRLKQSIEMENQNGLRINCEEPIKSKESNLSG